ncbi:glycosyltransferase [Alkaliphilus serpentinus]|uniref:Glycosyltransferase family 2 protein n=1 Tax=Alkaliphilus serpentinus TaxID=1482731 RepID=A0A833HNP4_9FIRM|nr:glycosyltransferase family 2 protein [Alkaliphilus serpentinus]KAB3529854.1 glycosyltransferase family 2 protein [Alkaliphilus serpentinus]
MNFIMVLTIVLILFGLFKLLKLYKVYLVLKKKEVDYEKLHKFLIIIPVYKEQLRIKQCIKAFERINYDNNKVKIVFATTNKEKVKPHTHDILEEYLQSNTTIFEYQVLMYPEEYGSSAEQVNYAFNQLRMEEANIVGIYNADSIPQKDTFLHVSEKFKDSKVNYLQQRISFFSNLNNNLFSLGYAYHQTIFELSVNMWKDLYGNGGIIAGRGLFLRKDKVGDCIFPENFFCEDISLYFFLKSNKEKIYTINTLEFNEAPPDLTSIIKQHSVWFHTANSFYELYKYVKSSLNNELPLLFWYFIFKRIIMNMIWLCAPLFLSLLCIYNPILLLMIGLYCIITTSIINKLTTEEYKGKHLLISSFSLMIYLFLYNLGPLKYIINQILKFFYTKEVVKYKTPRREAHNEKNYSNS